MLDNSNVVDIKLCVLAIVYSLTYRTCLLSINLDIVFDYRKLAVEKFTGGLYVRSLTL
jgi:hypothetical protein